MSEKDLIAKISELRQLQSLIDEANEQAESIKDALKLFMGDTEELRAGEYKISWKSVNSTRFDSTAFKKALPEIYAEYCKPSVSRRFVVS